MKTKLSIINCQLSILLIVAAFLAPMRMQADTAEQIRQTITTSFVNIYTVTVKSGGGNDTVTVTGGMPGVTYFNSFPLLNIDANVTVLWKATFLGYGAVAIPLAGTGVFEVAAGGIVRVTQDNNCIAINNTGDVFVKVSGGTVRATKGCAIYSTGASAKVSVSDGVVFAYGSGINGEGNVICTPNNANGFTGVTGTGVAIAWNQAAGNTAYAQGSNTDLVWAPAVATVKWDKIGSDIGISYVNGANSGIVPYLPVTVSGGSAIEKVEPAGINIFSQNGNLIVDSKTLAIKTVSVYDISGQLLKTVESRGNYVSIPLSFNSSILIVKVLMADGTIVTKKFRIGRGG